MGTVCNPAQNSDPFTLHALLTYVWLSPPTSLPPSFPSSLPSSLSRLHFCFRRMPFCHRAAVAIFNSRRIFHYIFRRGESKKDRNVHTNEYLMWNIDDAAPGICARCHDSVAWFRLPPVKNVFRASNDTMASRAQTHTHGICLPKFEQQQHDKRTPNNKKLSAICSQQLIRLRHIILVFP